MLFYKKRYYRIMIYYKQYIDYLLFIVTNNIMVNTNTNNHYNRNEEGRGGRGGRGGGGGRGNNFPMKPQMNNQQNIPINPQILEKWENPLSCQQKKYILSRFPNENIKLSYETIAPKKVLSSDEYDLCIAIPYGKKAYLWYTFYNNIKLCLLLELNRENQLNDNISIFSTNSAPLSIKDGQSVQFLNEKTCKIIPTDFELGTIVSGTIYEEIEDPKKHFLIDDIHMYKGILLSKWTFHHKSGFLYDFLSSLISSPTEDEISMALSVLWNSKNEIPNKISYNIRHIQYRSTKQILPHYNVSSNKKPLWNPTIISDCSKIDVEKAETEITTKKIINTNWKYDFSKQIYKRNVLFWVTADLAFDVYYLGALHNNKVVYCQNALVLNFKTSILLNSIFRNIKENQCLDSIEESDDETDFEDVREDKFVDLNKECIMECYFHFKFKKWVPLCVVSTTEERINNVVVLQSLL